MSGSQAPGAPPGGCGGLILGTIGFLSLAAMFILLLTGYLNLHGGFGPAAGGGGGGGQNAPAGPGGGGVPGGRVPGAGVPGAPTVTQVPAGRIPPVSDRFFTGGSATATATGDFSASAASSVNRIASYAQDGKMWLSFSPEGPGTPGMTEVLIVFNEPEDSVTVGQGPVAAIGQDEECVFDVQVTASLVKGRITCAEATVYRDGQPVGKAAIDATFEASS